MKNYIVYKHIFPNQKVYIGITGNSAKQRWQNGRGYEHCEYIHNAIQKYGWDNIKHEILYINLTKAEAEQKEIELIKKYKSNNPNYGYNIANGGNSVGMMSERTKKILSEQRKGNKNPMYDKTSDKHHNSKKINQYDMEGNFIKTWLCSADIERELKFPKTKIIACCKLKRKSSKNYQWRYFEGNTNNIEKYKKKDVNGENNPMHGRPSHRKIVIQKDLMGNYINEFESITKAGEITGIDFKKISACCNKKYKTTHGYVFEFKG